MRKNFTGLLLLFVAIAHLHADDEGVNTTSKTSTFKDDFVTESSFEKAIITPEENLKNAFLCQKFNYKQKWESRDMSNVSIDTTAFHEGQKSLKIKGCTDKILTVCQTVGVPPRKIYTVSGWVKNEDGKAGIFVTSNGFPGRLNLKPSKEVNGWKFLSRDIALFDGGDRLNIGLFLKDSNSSAWFDDISVKVKDNPSKNLFNNSGFNFCSNKNVPDYWGTYYAGIIRDWEKVLTVETSEGLPISKVKVLKIQNPVPLSLYYTTPYLPGNKDYTFSIYLKSDSNNLSIELPGGKICKLTQDWTRYSSCFNVANSKLTHEIVIKLIDKGTVWMAAPQLEYGKLLSEYCESYEDELKRRMLSERIDFNNFLDITVPFTEDAKNQDIGQFIKPCLQYSFYTNDKDAIISLEYCLNIKSTVTIKAVSICSRKEYVLASKINLDKSGKKKIILPIGNLPEGEYEIIISHDGDKKIKVYSEQLLKLRPGPVDVRINRFGRCLETDLKPFYSFNIYHSLYSFPEMMDFSTYWQLDDIKNKGFNSTIMRIYPPPMKNSNSLYSPGNDPHVRRVLNIFEKCEKIGLKVFAEFNFDTGVKNQSFIHARQQLLNFIEQNKSNKAILAWIIVDEPEFWWDKVPGKWNKENLKDLYESVKQIDPYRPVFINDGSCTKNGTYSNNASDIISIDRYPFYVYQTSLDYVGHQAYMINYCGKEQNKPTHFYMQLYGFWEGTREPTPKEVTLMTFMNIIFGTKNVGYFLYKPMSVELWESMPSLAVKTRNLLARTSEPGAEEIAGGQKIGSVYFSLWKTGDEYLLIAANSDVNATEATFHIPWLSIKEVNCGKEKIASGKDSFSFKFSPCEAIVFSIKSDKM